METSITPVVEWHEAAFPQPVSNIETLAQLVETQAQRTPDATAVSFPGQPEGGAGIRLSYRDLNQRANRIAYYLREHGVEPGGLVGICAERSVEMVQAVLAVIKAGAAYVPFDPNYPKDRLQFMLADTGTPIILTQEKVLEKIPSNSARMVCLDRDWREMSAQPCTNLPCEDGTAQLDQLAYVIYTSGSTGRPKGVAMPQRALVNLLSWQNDNWSFDAPARTLQFASLNFDVSFQEIFSTWSSGGVLVLVDEQTRRDSVALLELLRAQQVQRLFLPFVALKHLAEAAEFRGAYPQDLKEVITAGEQLKITPAMRTFFTQLEDCTLENQYGPSESHVVTAFRLEGPPKEWPILPSIGRPISNAKVLLLDENCRPVTGDMPGELYLGGECLAQGYLNRPDLTGQKFIADPFSGDPSARLYKTGDLGRILPDGNIEFLGRIDHQVKVGGFRIELGEIEAILHEHAGVREAAVIARENDEGDKQLVAYIVPQPDHKVRADELRNYLRQKLPGYMVPPYFVRLAALPVSPNGKVDRLALAKITTEEEDFSGPVKQPQTPLELQLQLVFERFLRRRPIGIDMSFFELGGDSLQALNLIIEIERVTGKKLPLGILYQSATVEGLAKILQKEFAEEWSALVPLQPLGSRPPLFLVHTTPGDVLGYGSLVFHLGTDQPCHGFQSTAFHSPERAQTRIEEMAAYYIKLLRVQQPTGPYLLGGWCYGGIIAVEMAHQLLAAGQKVAMLALIETPAPAPALSHFSFYLRRFWCLLKMKPREWKIYLREKIKYYRGARQENEMRFRRVDKVDDRSPKEVEELNRYLDRLEFVYNINEAALKFYQSRPYPGKVILFNAAEQDPALIHDPQYGWVGLASEIETYVIPGNHDTILMEPQVRQLSQQLTECMRCAVAEASPAFVAAPQPMHNGSIHTNGALSLKRPAVLKT